MTPGQDFLDAARSGRNRWTHYLLGALLIGFFWLALGAIPYTALALVAELDGDPATGLTPLGQLQGVDPLLAFSALMASFVSMLAGLFLAVRLIHRRPFLSLVAPDERVRWGRLGQGFLVWLVLAAALAALEAALYPGRYQWNFDPARFLPFAVVALVLTPLQTSAEELLFRGYALQGLGLRLRSPLILCTTTGILFTLPHLGNPEVAQDFWLLVLFYFCFGAFAAWITLRDGRLELALGLHAANNLFTGIFANFEGSAVQTPALFFANELDPLYNLIGSLAAMGVFYAVLCVRRKPAA